MKTIVLRGKQEKLLPKRSKVWWYQKRFYFRCYL